MPATRRACDHAGVSDRGRAWVVAGAGLLVYVVAAVLLGIRRTEPGGDAQEFWVVLFALSPTLVLAVALTVRRPTSPVGPALVWVAASPCLAWSLESWGTSYLTATPWPAAHLGAIIGSGAWVYNLTGFGLLCLVFPDGLLPGRRWALMPWVFLVVSVAVNVDVSADYVRYAGPDGTGNGRAGPLDFIAGAAFLVALGLCVGSLVVRYRKGDEKTRTQLRWLTLGAGAVPILLAAGWVLEAVGASQSVAYLGFLAAMLVLLPGTVAVAVLRHDLLDIDRLLTQSISWVLTSVLAAGVFALVTWALVEVVGVATGSASGLLVAAFVAALILLPVHRLVHRSVGRLIDRDRTITLAMLQEFVQQVRDGQQPPEAVEFALREALGDPLLLVLLRSPETTTYVDLTGAEVEPPSERCAIPLLAANSDIGLLLLGNDTARQQRRARDAAVAVRLPIEVSRLRLELRGALVDAQASRARIVAAVTEERRRLERDLHDGAQQGIVAVGMRLRSVQALLAPEDRSFGDLEEAVLALESMVGELRRLAHGVRPGRLDDGLDVAIRQLASTSPIPVSVEMGKVDVDDTVATTAYFIVAESLANTMKHAAAHSARVSLTQTGKLLTVEVSDDGRGGAAAGRGLESLRDRVAALGGRLKVTSPAGDGTTVRAEL
jgi:signal transduction histidine kinase